MADPGNGGPVPPELGMVRMLHFRVLKCISHCWPQINHTHAMHNIVAVMADALLKDTRDKIYLHKLINDYSWHTR